MYHSIFHTFDSRIPYSLLNIFFTLKYDNSSIFLVHMYPRVIDTMTHFLPEQNDKCYSENSGNLIDINEKSTHKPAIDDADNRNIKVNLVKLIFRCCWAWAVQVRIRCKHMHNLDQLACRFLQQLDQLACRFLQHIMCNMIERGIPY